MNLFLRRSYVPVALQLLTEVQRDKEYIYYYVIR